MALVNQLKAIEQSLLSSTANAQSLSKALTDLQAAAPDLSKLSSDELAAYTKTLEAIKKVDAALKGLGKTGKDNLEQLRKNLENVTDKTKRWVEELAKAGGLTGKLASGILQVSNAAGQLSKTGDVGQFIQQMTAGIPVVSMFGFVIGAAVSTQIKFQDQLRQINRTFIDATASTGQFARGLQIAATRGADFRENLAAYEKLTGISRDQTLQLTSALGQAGLSLEEMGIDEQTGKVKTFGESVDEASGKMGALSTVVAIARSSGLDFSQVTEQIGFQVKQMGEEVSDAAEMFVTLQHAADRSKLSTQILLPIVRSMHEQYKFLGIDSAEAAKAVGRAGEAARRAGLGAGMGAGLMGRAVSGLMGAGLGVQAFLGQQMRMGGGLAAGFAMRQRPAEAAAGVGDVARSLFGGRAVSREQAATNEQLAGMRAGQELMISQLTGLNQLESSAFLDMSNKLKDLDDTGQGQSKEAEELKKKMADATRGEGEYRARTLTAQEKMARLMEVLTASVGKIFMTFMAAFMKGMGAEMKGGAGGMIESFNKMVEAALTGEGIDTAADMLEKEMKNFEGIIMPTADTIGNTLGKLSGITLNVLIPTIEKAAKAIDSIVQALGGWKTALIGGGVVTGLLQLSKLLGGEKGITGGLSILGKTLFQTQISLKSVLKAMVSTPGHIYELGKAAWSAKGSIAGLGLAAVAIGYMISEIKSAADEANKATKERIQSENKYQGNVNKLLQRTTIEQEALKAKTGKTGAEALEAARKGTAKGPEELVQAFLEAQKRKETLAASGGSTKSSWFGGVWTPFGTIGGGPSTLTKGGADPTQIKALSEEIASLREQIAKAGGSEMLQATAVPKGGAKDAWDINKAGWLYASRGDVVVDASSLAKYMGAGERGSALRGTPDLNQAFERAAVYNVPDANRAFPRGPAPTDPGRALRGGEPVEQEVVIHLVGIEDKLGQLFDTRLHVNIEKGVVQVGKEGASKLRHGANGASSWSR